MISEAYINTFLAVTRLGSFSRAAYELNISQPAVSGHIAKLEKEVGAELFTRTGKKVILTDAGKVTRSCFLDVRKRLDRLEMDLADLAELRGGTIRLGASRIIGVYMLPKILKAFQVKFPDIELSVAIHSAHTILEQVEDNRFDLAIVAGDESIASRNVGAKVVAQDKTILIASPDSRYAAGGRISVAEAQAESFILPGPKTSTATSLISRLTQLGLKLNGTLEIDDAGAIKRAVEEGAGIAFISKAVVQKEIAAGSLVELRLENFTTSRDIVMVWRQDRAFSKNTQAFMRFLQSELPRSLAELDEMTELTDAL